MPQQSRSISSAQDWNPCLRVAVRQGTSTIRFKQLPQMKNAPTELEHFSAQDSRLHNAVGQGPDKSGLPAWRSQAGNQHNSL